MATQQAYHAYTQHKGALMPGQTIAVNKYTVTVERYLSQGGFAQVYLVRTQAPVYNTTHHVLKHIVVTSESMLTEVKKEVDVMRLLRGHPNIVYLIDAAWARMPNGAYEVYILMEFCPGGGIIDMMNRRLRERLTEAEILQIFVEVCEGVAHMHNSRPPLLHRDLKVENILQSSATSYKLCDFGSASTITKSPTNIQEIQALEADLNRHTTLQYRAPEMIDLHSRRPIDEKSDVWALGVLLYKLCYYTTPFEEHGPLAILNVQYRFPSYPVYSQQMMHLISSMLREHGSQRPTVFELLAHVHTLRGTKSPYSYPLPVPTPLSPRQPELKASPLDGVITYRRSPQPSPQVKMANPSEVTVAQERRGRPKPTTTPFSNLDSSRPSTPLKHDVDKSAWSPAIPKNTPPINQRNVGNDDAWNITPVTGIDKQTKTQSPSGVGFNDDFAQKLWAGTNVNKGKALLSTTPSPRPPTYSPKLNALPHATLTPNGEIQKLTSEPSIRPSRDRDAFEGLGLMVSASKPAPTLGEARKLRTGLAVVNTTTINRQIRPSPSPRLRPKTHTPKVSPIPPLRPLEPDSSAWTLHKPQSTKDSSAESRFPSLAELDIVFSSPNSSSLDTGDKREGKLAVPSETPALPPRPKKVSNGSTGVGHGSSPVTKPMTSGHVADVTRSEQLAGLRDIKEGRPRKAREEISAPQRYEKSGYEKRDRLDSPSLPNLEKLVPIRPLMPNRSTTTSSTSTPRISESSIRPSPPTIDHSVRSQDWLTGENDLIIPSRPFLESRLGGDIFKIRDSPSKRASVIEANDFVEGTVPQQGHASTPPKAQEKSSVQADSPTVSRFIKSFPEIDTAATHQAQSLTDNWSPITTTFPSASQTEKDKIESSSSSDEGPEDPTARSTVPQSLRTKRRGRQSSVHDLVDLWGGATAGPKEKQSEGSTMVKKNANHPPLKPSYLSIPPAASPIRKGSPNSSNIPTRSPVSSNFPTRPPISPGNEQASRISPSTVPPSPARGRSRPQSMFVFPTKATDSPSVPSASLLPPEEPKPRAGRRTSITDMVQRFEAIQASGRVTMAAAPPSPVNVNRPLPITRDSLQDPVTTRTVKPNLDKIAVALPGLSTPSTLSNDSTKHKISSSVINARAPLHVRKQSVVDKPEVVPQVEYITPRTRAKSIAHAAPIKLPGLANTNRQPTISSEDPTRQPPNEATTSFNPTNDVASSPERPYQGVGKLIDQWQRKSAEAEASRNAILAKRASLVPPKRAGLVPGSGTSS